MGRLIPTVQLYWDCRRIQPSFKGIHGNFNNNNIHRNRSHMYQIMAEILLMKTIKLIISWYCYIGTSIVAMDQLPGIDLTKSIKIPTAMQHIIIYLLIVFWVVKISWFVYDKFYLNRKERNLQMDKTKEEIIDMKENHKYEKGVD